MSGVADRRPRIEKLLEAMSSQPDRWRRIGRLRDDLLLERVSDDEAVLHGYAGTRCRIHRRADAWYVEAIRGEFALLVAANRLAAPRQRPGPQSRGEEYLARARQVVLEQLAAGTHNWQVRQAAVATELGIPERQLYRYLVHWYRAYPAGRMAMKPWRLFCHTVAVGSREDR